MAAYRQFFVLSSQSSMGKEMPLYTENNRHYIDEDLAKLRISQQKVRTIIFILFSRVDAKSRNWRMYSAVYVNIHN